MAQGEVGGLRTVECLRGRLLAERLASTAAREEAELMNKRLVELERRLAEEIEARNKAEKRLKRVLKKLESLKIFGISCSLSNVSDDSESSPSACFSVFPPLEEGRKSIAVNLASAPCEGEGKLKQMMLQISSSDDIEGEISGALSLESVNQSVSSLEECWGSSKTDQLPQQQSRVSLCW